MTFDLNIITDSTGLKLFLTIGVKSLLVDVDSVCGHYHLSISLCRWMTSWMLPSHPPSSCRNRSTFIKRRTVGSWRNCRSFSRSEDWSWRSIFWRQKPYRKRYWGVLSALFGVITAYLNAETDGERGQIHTLISHPRPPMHNSRWWVFVLTQPV